MSTQNALDALGAERQSLNYKSDKLGNAGLVSVNPTTLNFIPVNTPAQSGVGFDR